MPHENYVEITANSYYELGIQQGDLFRRPIQEAVKEFHAQPDAAERRALANQHLAVTRERFPRFLEELEGYADGARVRFKDLWVLCTESDWLDDADDEPDRCTTVVTNGGSLIGHNEDWAPDARDSIFVVRRTLPHVTILELFYVGTLGGNAIAVNSHGFVQAINSLAHQDHQVGVPRNIVARWLAETRDPSEDYHRLKALRRSSGYSHSLVHLDGQTWSIECTANRQKLTRPKLPFVHTNHYLTELRRYDRGDFAASRNRFHRASARAEETMSTGSLAALLSDVADGVKASVFNERTIARMIVDLGRRTAHIWLLREKDKGWVQYDLGFLLGRRP